MKYWTQFRYSEILVIKIFSGMYASFCYEKWPMQISICQIIIVLFIQTSCSYLKVVDHKREIANQMEVFQEKLELAEEKSRVKVSEMEREVRNHRERTVAILLDKDKEIKHLKTYIATISRSVVGLAFVSWVGLLGSRVSL